MVIIPNIIAKLNAPIIHTGLFLFLIMIQLKLIMDPRFYFPIRSQLSSCKILDKIFHDLIQSALDFVKSWGKKKGFTKSKIHRFEYILHGVCHIVCLFIYIEIQNQTLSSHQCYDEPLQNKYQSRQIIKSKYYIFSC